MAILLAHEMGHWLVARRYGVEQSLPYFIPAPTIFGTLGAMIFMRSQPSDRRALLHFAVAGPIAGMLLALPAVAWGLAHSAIATKPQLCFGSSLLFGAMNRVFGPGAPVGVLDLHPVAVAGWVGLFVTCLNLIPASQLDGGHIAYALFGEQQGRVSRLLSSLCCLWASSWACTTTVSSTAPCGVFWSLFLFIIGIRHPPVRTCDLLFRPVSVPWDGAPWFCSF